MPGISADRLLASTAVALLLSASAAFSDPANTAGDKPASAAPVSAAPVSAAPAVAAPAPTLQPPAAPAAAASTSDDSAAKNGSAAAAPSAVPSPDAAAAPAANPPAPAAAEAKPDSTNAGVTPAATASQPPAPETAAAPPAPAGPDAAIADELRGLGTGKFDRLITNKKDRAQIAAFYSGRNYKPLWITDGKANARATAAIAYLAHVDADGLFPSDYPVPKFDALSTPEDLANAEMELTASVITYAHHASIGRVAFSRVSADIEYDRPAPEPAAVLARAADATDR